MCVQLRRDVENEDVVKSDIIEGIFSCSGISILS